MVAGLPRRLFAVAAIGAALAGCDAFERSGYQFVRSPSTGTYLKVPEEWTVHGHRDVTSFLDRIGKKPANFTATVAFVSTFGASSDLIEYPFDPLGPRPAGMVRVRDLEPQERDRISFATMRDEIVPVEQGAQAGQLELLSREEIRPGEDTRGERLRYVVNDPDTGERFIIDQTTVLDGRTRRLYLLAVGCQASCFERHEGQIDEVVTSLTIKER